MRKIYIIVLALITSNVLASGYVDPSKRVKKPLLEEASVEGPSEGSTTSEKVEAKDSRDPDIVQYCACLNYKRLAKKKQKIINTLVSNKIIDDGDWRLRKKGYSENEAAEKALKKVIYKKDIDITEVECELIPLNYKKVSKLKPVMIVNQKACRYVDI